MHSGKIDMPSSFLISEEKVPGCQYHYEQKMVSNYLKLFILRDTLRIIAFVYNSFTFPQCITGINEIIMSYFTIYVFKFILKLSYTVFL